LSERDKVHLKNYLESKETIQQAGIPEIAKSKVNSFLLFNEDTVDKVLTISMQKNGQKRLKAVIN
jgi:hypothetical protein